MKFICVLLLMVCILVLNLGFGPADYHIQIYDDYYILRMGRNRFSLDRRFPPSGPDDKSWAFSIICDEIATYGNFNTIIYGTTINNNYYLLDPPKPIVILHDRKEWEDALGQLGIHELVLKTPSPPDDNLGLPHIATLAWIAVGIGGTFGVLVLLFITLRLRGQNEKTR